MSWIPIVMLATLVPAMAGAVAAQQPSLGRVAGSPEPPKVPLNDIATRKVHAMFGECVVKRYPSAASEYVLQLAFEDKAHRRLMSKLADPDCLTDAMKDSNWDIEMRLPADTMRYALADVLIRAELRTSPISSFDSVPPLPRRILSEAEMQPNPGKRLSAAETKRLADNLAAAKGSVFMAAFGECVVRTNPGASFRLVNTEVTSDAESAHLQALVPTLGACMPAQRTISMGKSTVRGAIAMNYYRLAKAALTTTRADSAK